MDSTRFDAFARALGDDTEHASSRRSLLAVLGGGLAAALTPTLTAEARRKKRRGNHGKGRKCKGKNKNKPKCQGGGGGGDLGLREICEPGSNTCQSGLTCDTPTTRHTCSSTVEGVDTWCCVPPGGKCTECDCCGDYYCDFGDENPDGACIPNPEG